jgi:ABC-type nickel/cobalt efflux system permease component RcnA
MTWQEILQIISTGGLVLVGAYLVWHNTKAAREQRAWQQKQDEHMMRLVEWNMHRMADAAMPEKDKTHE